MLPSLPGLPVSPYGLVFAATVLGVFVFGIRAIQRDGSYPPYLGYQLALLCLLGHGIGGRVVYARTHWGHLLEDWPRLLDVSLGGSTHLESVLCSVALWIVLLRLRRVSLRDLMDLAAPITMAGQAVGRSACLVAGCCFGTPTAVPWAITFTHAEAVAPLGIPLHPVQVYDMLAKAAIAGLLFWYRPRRRFRGEVILLYFTLYPVARFLLEFFRGDRDRGRQHGWLLPGVLTHPQSICILLLLMAALCWVIVPRLPGSRELARGRPAAPAP